MTEFLQHGRIRLALHRLQAARTADSHPLLLLHGLGESQTAHPGWAYTAWPGAVYALDFTGHGASTIPAGRVDKHLARFDHASAGLLDREELDAVAANLPHGSTAAVLSYEGEPPVDAIEAWTAAGVRVISGG